MQIQVPIDDASKAMLIELLDNTDLTLEQIASYAIARGLSGWLREKRIEWSLRDNP